MSNLDVYLLDLFGIALLVYLYQGGFRAELVAGTLAWLVYCNPQNVILLSVLLDFPRGRFLKTAGLAAAGLAALLGLSRAWAGSWVSSSALPADLLLQLPRLHQLHEL